ncbi:MAG: MlaE family lipid ABC transporter permease subunit [Rhodospirillaceae bacterium]|nr:MlaE family lipid ABC transporter permease subunit [Rhodospirillales bacterium]
MTVSGIWTRSAALARGDEALHAVSAIAPPGRLQVVAVALEGWDSTLIAFLLRLRAAADRAGIPLEWEGLPAGVRRLVELASAVPERAGTARSGERAGLLAQVGGWAKSMVGGTHDTVRFLGQIVLALAAFVRGRAVYRREDLVRTIQETGVQALPIVATISLLIGLILAFIGAVQLSQFGAAIYVADLVGLAMTREMAAVMTAIVVAGRTGAAFAAQLGTMQGNEEIDALATLGIPPVEFLVLPRMLALVLMMPLLYVYGCFIGLFGGYLVGIGLLDLGGQAYVDRTREAVGMADFAIGFVKSAVFGAVVAFAGCQRGMEAGRSAAAVGQATTSAVVSSIVYIIVIDAVFAVLLNIMGI